MAGLNKAMIIGHLGRDPEMRHTQSGTAVANFSVATSERFTDKSGEKQERTEWHNIVAWGKLAEICERYLVKGKQVYLEGRLQTRKWEDKNGNDRYTTEIVANQMQMLGSGGQKEQNAGDQNNAPTQSNVGSDDVDDLPF